MTPFRHPLDALGLLLAIGLALLGALQLRQSTGFTSRALPAQARITGVETPKRGLLDASADSIATVEFTIDGQVRSAQLAEPVESLGLAPGAAVGSEIPIRFDPETPARVHYGSRSGREAAYVLFALAAGALAAPALLRRVRVAPGGG